MAGSGMPNWMSSPTSSKTSRVAHSGRVSTGSSLPLGQDQSSYRSRWIIRTSSPPPLTRQTRAPAARTANSPVRMGSESLERTKCTPLAPDHGPLAGARLDQPGLDVFQRSAVLVLVVPGPLPLGVQVPAGGARIHVAVQQRDQLCGVLAAAQRDQGLDAAVQVAVH